MFVRNTKVDVIKTKEIDLKVNSLVKTTRKSQTIDWRVLSNQDGTLVIQEVGWGYNVSVIKDNEEFRRCGQDRIKLDSISIEVCKNNTPVYFSQINKTKFVYQKEVSTSNYLDVPIVIGDEFHGYIYDDYVFITITAVTHNQLVLNCSNTENSESFFAILDKNTLKSDGLWKINTNVAGLVPQILVVDSDDVRYIE
jgi:hypothetical protein